MVSNSIRIITAWTMFVETLVLSYPLSLLQPYRSADPALFTDVPADLEPWHEVISFFYDSVKTTQELRNNDPSSIPEQSRKVLRDVMTKYEGIDTPRRRQSESLSQ
jgi:hypothetical protein